MTAETIVPAGNGTPAGTRKPAQRNAAKAAAPKEFTLNIDFVFDTTAKNQNTLKYVPQESGDPMDTPVVNSALYVQKLGWLLATGNDRRLPQSLTVTITPNY